jgi:hypothetical protein
MEWLVALTCCELALANRWPARTASSHANMPDSRGALRMPALLDYFVILRGEGLSCLWMTLTPRLGRACV